MSTAAKIGAGLIAAAFALWFGFQLAEWVFPWLTR
jgi:hypothetical protein